MPRTQILKSPKSSTLTPYYLTSFAVIVLVLSALNILVYYSPKPEITVHAQEENRTPLLQTYYLKGLLASHPTYREGWIALAKLQYELGNMDDVQMAITKVKEIDPNDTELEGLQKLLSNR